MNGRPLVWFAICFVAGSAAAARLGAQGAAFVAGAGLLLAIAAIAGGVASRRLAIACLLALCLAGGARLWADASNVTALKELQFAAEADGPRAAYAVEARGMIVSAVEVDGDRVQFHMEADAVHVAGEAPLRLAGERFMVHLRLDAQPEQDIAAAWKRGDRISIAGELTRPAAATNSGGFDYRRYLSSQRIHWLLKGKGIAAVTPEAAGPAWSAAALLGRVDDARAALGARFDSLYPSDQSGYMKGLILGIREDIDPERFQQFARLGLTHILAISGLHVGVFMYSLGAILRLLRLPRERILLVLMFAVPCYVALTGASPSVLRAGLMAVLGLIAARMGKLKDGLHLIAAAAVAILALDPYYLDDVSFQLSFIVTLGLIVGVPPLRRAMPVWKRGRWLQDLGAVTLVAQLVSFPLTIYYFNQFHLLSLLANFVLVPFISFVVLSLGTASLLVSFVWEGGAQLLASAANYSNVWTFDIVERLAKVDSLRTIWATPPVWWVAAWLALLWVFFRLLDSRFANREAMAKSAFEIVKETAQPVGEVGTVNNPTQPVGEVGTVNAPAPPVAVGGTANDTMPLDAARAIAAAGMPIGTRDAFSDSKWVGMSRKPTFKLALLLCASLMLLAYAYAPDVLNNKAVVSFLDVGQGDAALIRTPSGKYALIDGGGTLSFRKPGEEWRERSDPFEVGAKVVVPLLMKRGVQKIDLLVISHLDSDHMRGLIAVIEHIPIKQIWWNGTMKDSDDVKQLMNRALTLGIPLYSPVAGASYELDSHAVIEVLWPPPLVAPDHRLPVAEDQNEVSIVLTLNLYGKHFLFTGDINAATERKLIRMLKDEGNSGGGLSPVPVDVMKVAHHGSRHSTGEEWLSFWKPFGAVASAGASNSYGHPHPDTIGRLARSGAHIWRTDLDGEVAFIVNKLGFIYGR